MENSHYPEDFVYNCPPTTDKGLAVILMLETLHLHWTDNKCSDYIFLLIVNNTGSQCFSFHFMNEKGFTCKHAHSML